MIFIGGVVGLSVSVSVLTTAPIVGGTVAALLAGVLAPLLPLVGAVLGWLGPIAAALPALPLSSWAIVAGFAAALLYIFAYLVASVSLAPVPGVGGSLATPAVENFFRGLVIGATSGLNIGIWTLMGAAPIGLTVGVVGFAAVFPFLSRNVVYQGVLGWSSLLMPMSYTATTLGFILFILNVPFAIAAGGLGAIRFDSSTATMESSGGLVAVSPSRGFNLGNFSFLRSPAFQSPFAGPGGVSVHETGHTLTVAAFSGVFHWIDAVDENVPPFMKGLRAYGELIPESHGPGGGRPWVGAWSP
jgi:hypothetical protein